MPAAPLPLDEPQRIAALEALRAMGLDDKPEERFDRITRLIQSLLDVPVALITLVAEDVQWYKSNAGMAGSGSPRDQSFCAYTILSDEPLVVSDARLDPRFSDNPFAFADPSIRFYAGLPLHAANGRRLGALCAIDSRPRTISERELKIMRSLADIAEAELNSFGLAQAMRRLLQQENQFRNLVEHSSDLIHTLDSEGRILYANPAWRSALGYSTGDLAEGLSLFQIVHPDFIPAARERVRRIFAGETIPRFESQFIANDGHLLQVEGNVTSYEQEGLSRAVCGIYRDVTARKALEEESRRAQTEAEQVSLAKSQFLANISHEIRTPLNGITGMASMLLISGLTDPQLRYARTIDSSARVLLSLVNQILDFSKLDAGAADLEHISFSLPTLVDEVIALFSVRAEEKKLNLRSFVAVDVPSVVSGDPDRLRQVLTNLLGNAVKFTETGEVRLDVRWESSLEGTAGSDPLLRFTVMDTGIGLEPGASSRIFDAFAQADPSTTRKYGGTGLGLAISRQIVRLMGGDIHVHSAPGEGATFWFTARLHSSINGPPTLPAGDAAPVPPSARPLRILIAEDNPVNQLVLTEQLSTLGHSSAVVSNGQEALAALDGSRWDAVLLDCQMPVMDGYEAVAAIRAREAAGTPRIWVVAVTANALTGQREACLRAGMDDFLSKPFTFQQLAQVVSRIPSAREAAPVAVDIARLGNLASAKTVSGENLLEKMVYHFTDSSPQMLDQLDNALAQGDLPSAVRTAHKLGGGCGYFGADTLHELCNEVERFGRDGNKEAVRAIAPRIREEYRRVQSALKNVRPSPLIPHENPDRRG